MAYSKTNWVNDSSPAISAENLNKIENELESLDNGLGDVYTKEEIGDLEDLTTTDKTSVVNAVNELNAPEKWVSVGDTIPTDGRKVFFQGSKNLFDKNTTNILNAKMANNTITADNNEKMVFVECKPNTTYTFSKSMSSPIRNSIGTTQTLPTIGVATDNAVYSATSPKTITTNASAKYIVWLVYSMSDTTNTLQQMLDSMQIELGSSATTYEPYIEQDLIVNGGKFIADQLVSVGATNSNDGRRVWFSKSVNLYNGVSKNRYCASNGSIVDANQNYLGLENKVAVKPSTTYTITFYNVTMLNITLAQYDASGTFISRTGITSNTFTTGNTTYFIYVHLFDGNGGYTTINGNVQLQAGSTATSFEPYIDQGIYIDNEQYGDNYSYGEQVIGKWVDGKKIYRKVVTFNINASAMTTQYTHNISNIETILPSCKALVKRGAVDVYVVPFVYPNSSSDMVNYGIGMNINSTKITLYIGSSMRSAISSYPAIVVLEYTKSTD